MGTGDSFGAALNLQFVKDFAVMPFDRVQGEEKPLADLSIRESLGNELAVFLTRVGSTVDQRRWLDKGLGRG